MARRGNRTKRKIPPLFLRIPRMERPIVVLLHSTGSRIMRKRTSQRVGDTCSIRNTVLFRQGSPRDQDHTTYYHRVPHHSCYHCFNLVNTQLKNNRSILLSTRVSFRSIRDETPQMGSTDSQGDTFLAIWFGTSATSEEKAVPFACTMQKWARGRSFPYSPIRPLGLADPIMHEFFTLEVGTC
jgi:hypothetical protein